jgi:hypothetical protein
MAVSGSASYEAAAAQPNWRRLASPALDALAEVGQVELRTAGAFLLPGFAKFVVVEKPATPAHDGIKSQCAGVG